MTAPKKVLKRLGLDPSGLPGTVIPFLLIAAAIEPLRGSSALNFFVRLGAAEVFVLVLAAFGVMLNKVLADAVLDRVYDHFYGEGFGRWEESTSRNWLFFPPGQDLRVARHKVRQHFIENENEVDYGRKTNTTRARFINTIYKPVMGHLEAEASGIYRAVQAELSWSKSARNSIIPLLALGVSVLAAGGSPRLAAGLFALAVTLFLPFFSLRFMHQVHLYHRYWAEHQL